MASKALWTMLAMAVAAAHAQTYTVLHRFTGPDGSVPGAGLIADPAGNLFGTTEIGGVFNHGTIFKLGKTGLTVLYSFTGGVDGNGPCDGLVRDTAGNLYGTTYSGGAEAAGTVFKLDTAGAETVLHSFTGKNGDGKWPLAGLIRDAAGNLYGATEFGGEGSGAGTVFKLNQSGEKVLYRFTGGADGNQAYGGVIQDSAGNLYGTTNAGGTRNIGVVFLLDGAGVETVLHSFTGAGDGAFPWASLLRDSAGNLYGTTEYGGASAFGYGVVFKLDSSGVETVLYSFTGGPGGADPVSGLVQDAAGNLYGTAFGGGSAEGLNGNGVVFQIDTTGIETVLHTFSGGADGGHPHGSLWRDAAGNLYGTTANGGIGNNGVVFKIAP